MGNPHNHWIWNRRQPMWGVDFRPVICVWGLPSLAGWLLVKTSANLPKSIWPVPNHALPCKQLWGLGVMEYPGQKPWTCVKKPFVKRMSRSSRSLKREQKQKQNLSQRQRVMLTARKNMTPVFLSSCIKTVQIEVGIKFLLGEIAHVHTMFSSYLVVKHL